MATKKKGSKRTRVAKEHPGLNDSAARNIALYTPGNTGLKRDRSGYIWDEWHPRLSGQRAMKIYREMNDNDPILGSVSFAMRTFIEQAPVEVEARNEGEPESEFQAQHIRDCIDDMETSWSETLSDILSMIWAGYSIHGEYFKLRRGAEAPIPQLKSMFNDGALGWRKIEIRDQESIREWHWDDSGALVGAQQMAPPDYATVNLPMANHVLFRTVSNKNNPEGRSLYRNAYTSYWRLKRYLDLEAIGVERDMAGMLIFEMPYEYLSDSADDEQKAAVEIWRQVVERMRRGEHEGAVFPASEDQDGKTGFSVRLLASGGRRPMDVDALIKRLESRIALSLLGEAALLGMQGDIGSWSLASSKTKMFALAINSIMKAIAGVFNTRLIPRLIQRNGWPVEASPLMKFGDIEKDDATEAINSMVAAVGGGLLTPTPDLEQYIRIRMGLPIDEDISDMQAQDAAARLAENGGGVDGGAAAAEIAAEQVVPIEQQAGTSAESLSADDAAELVGVPRSTIMRGIRNGQLPGAKVGNQFRVFRSDLMDYMRGGKRAA